MLIGTVEQYIKTEGTGTIRADDGQTYFVHRMDIQGDRAILEHGDRVAFEVKLSNGRHRAVEIRRI